MICTKCGLEVDNGAAFCGNCGTPVQAATQPATTAPQATTVQTPTPAPATTFPGASPITAAPSPIVANPAPMPGIPVPGPAYGVPSAYTRPGGGKAIASFVLGIIGLLGWLIPIIGLVLATLSLIFGTMSTKSNHRKLAVAGVVLGSITLVLSLLSFAYNISVQTKERNGQSVSTSIVTPVLGRGTNVVTPLLQPY